MAAHNPAKPLPNATHEAYVQARAKGFTPSQAAAGAGLKEFRRVERQKAFQARLRELSGEPAAEPGVSLEWLVAELKRTVSGARAAGQYRNANEALSQLAELFARHPELRGEKKASAQPTEAREQRRLAHRAALAVVPGSAHE